MGYKTAADQGTYFALHEGAHATLVVVADSFDVLYLGIYRKVRGE